MEPKVRAKVKVKQRVDLRVVMDKLLKAFSGRGDESKIVGRQAERDTIANFITSCIEEKKPGLLYVCGHPG